MAARLKPLSTPAPYVPFPPEQHHCAALRALRDGVASEHQQKLALEYIYAACGVSKTAYRPDSARDTDFALGKQFVAGQIISAMNTIIKE